MNRPTQTQIDTARRLLAHEVAEGSATMTTALRLHDKLLDHLSNLIGAVGVQMLFVRSAKLARADFACFAGVSLLGGTAKLRDCLQSQDPAVPPEAAVALFATFFALLTTFIGERLTMQALRSAWPTIDETAPTESKT